MRTTKAKTKVVVSVLALAGLAVFSLFAVGGSLEPSAPPAPTMKTLDQVEPRIPIHASDLPLTISEPNSYYLVEDVNFTDDANHAITIECNDVTIDLMGYTLKGPDSGIKSGIYINGRTNVEIRNGTIRDFGGDGIHEHYSSARGHRVINVRAMSNEGYGIRLPSNGNLVKDCTAGQNNSTGICAYEDSTITGNTAYNNGSFGIQTIVGNTVTGNTAYDNGNSGIVTGIGNTVTGNTCHDNDVDGIAAASGSTVTGNTCHDNGDDGISAGSGSTVTGNTCYDNVGHGIYAFNYCLVDQNTAYNNGTNMYTWAGCVLGVNCAP